MSTIKNAVSFAAMFCGLLIVFAATPTKASAQYFIKGSYQWRCHDIYTKGPDLHATCKPKDDSSAYPKTILRDYFECDGDIWNDNGNLKCIKNSNSPLMLKAKAAIDKGYHRVYDGDAGKVYMFDAGYRDQLRKMFDLGFAENFYKGILDFESGGRTAEGFYFDQLNAPQNTQAKINMINLAFKRVYGQPAPKPDLDAYMSKPTAYVYVFGAETQKKKDGKKLPILITRGDSDGGGSRPVSPLRRGDDISNAFKNIYGYPPDAERTAFWTAKKASYEEIAAEEAKRLNSDPIARKLMIARVYKDTFGRVANKKEIDYWLPKAEYHKQIFDLNRQFLYGAGGSADLVETVRRALTQKSGKAPNDAEVNEAIKKYRQTKAIFDEMN